MKIVPPTSYDDAYNRAMDLESETKTSKKKKKDSSSDEDDSSEGSNSDGESGKKVQALQKDMLRMMKELKVMKGGPTKGSFGARNVRRTATRKAPAKRRPIVIYAS